jgi:hypothetical protein
MKLYRGEVISWERPYYHIRYSDGDEEDMSPSDIRSLVHQSRIDFAKIDAYLGKRVSKTFGHRKYEGVVVDANCCYFRVEYDDGDREQLTTKELEKLLPEHSRITKALTAKSFLVNNTPKKCQSKSLKSSKTPSKKARTPSTKRKYDDVILDSRPSPDKIKIMDRRIRCIELECNENARHNFLNEHFKTLLMKTACYEKQNKMLEKRLTFFNNVYELVSSKIEDKVTYRPGVRERTIEYLYVATEGPDMSTINIQEEFEKIADFASLPSPRVVAKRMQLGQSYGLATIPPFTLSSSAFEMIPDIMSHSTDEAMGDGCGFIPCDMLERMLGSRSPRNLAVQVRGFGPRVGIFKGMLVRKPNISRIQLPDSMLKVKPSVITSEDNDWVKFVIIRISPSQLNVAIGKYFDSGVISEKRTASYRPQLLSPMILKLWKYLGVPECNIRNHLESQRHYPTHAWLVGVSDPTNEIPRGHVFVTGFKGRQSSKRVFLTRSPCARSTDGRVLPTLLTKPPSMSEVMWHWLQALPFGGLIFSTMADTHPLPSICGAGDLDGDLYFVCWDKDIVANVKPKLSAELSMEPKAKKIPYRNPNWFRDLQEFLVTENDCGTGKISKLYRAMESKLKETDDMDHPDYVALAEAYIEQIDNCKHGGEINLPAHLRAEFKI